MTKIIAARYSVIEQLGAGGMGIVYKATDNYSQQIVAIKQLHPTLTNLELIERFKREGEALRELNHPNIVKMLDAVEEDGNHYLVMEYVSGGDLKSLVETEGKLDYNRCVDIAIDLADALTRAHRLNIIHRDLKPANILISDKSILQLTDFGVAHIASKERVTDTDALIGTIDYLPPEVFNEQPFGTEGDIWAFGVILFEMLTGVHPFSSSSLGATIQSITTGAILDLEDLSPEVPIELIDLVYRMLERDPRARITSVRYVGAILEDIFHERTTTSSKFHEPRFNTPVSVTTTKLIRSNLPKQSTPFVGRDHELLELKQLMQSADIRLVTVIAPGGMGKTRLALEVASSIKEQYLDGVFFVNLAPLADASGVATAIADAIKFQFQPGVRSPQDQLIDYFREKRSLLVFDNFEHVTDATDIVGLILQAAPGVKVIATSREKLNLTSEHLYLLTGMDVTEWETAREASQYASARLFTQTAKRVQSGFELEDGNVGFVARICKLVAGSPLGIVLAASWQEMLNTQEIVLEMERSIDFLETTARDIPPRQRSMRAVFDYSWNLMSQNEQDVFMKLGIFRGGFTRDAAQAVTGASLRDLMSLVQKSLLGRDPDTGRYYIHEMTRQYALDRLMNSGDYTSVADTHSKYFLSLAIIDQSRLMASSVDMVKTVDTEFDNILVGLDTALKSNSVTRIDSILLSLYFHSLLTGTDAQGVKLFERIETALYNQSADVQSLSYWRARLYRISCGVFIMSPNEILPQLQEAIPYLEAVNAHFEHAFGLAVMSRIQMYLGNLDQAQHLTQLSYDIAVQQDDTWGMANAQPNLAYIIHLKGDSQTAFEMQKEVIEQAKAAGSAPFWLALSYNNMGEFQHALGKHDEANEYFQLALDFGREANHTRTVAYALSNLGNIAHAQARLDDAMNYSQQSLDLLRDIGDRQGMADAHVRMADSLRYVNRDDEARSELEKALQLYEDVGNNRGIGDTCTLLARLYQSQGEFAAAETYLVKGLEARQTVNSPSDIIDSLLNLILLFGAQRKIDEAIKAIAEAEARLVGNQEDHPILRTRLDSITIFIQLVQGQYEQPYAQFPAMAETERSRQVPLWNMYMLGYWGTACLGLGKLDEAATRFTDATRTAIENDLLSLNYINNIGLAILLAHLRGDYQRAYGYLVYLLREWELLELSPIILPLMRINDIKTQLTEQQLAQAEKDSQNLDLESVVQALLAEFSG